MSVSGSLTSLLLFLLLFVVPICFLIYRFVPTFIRKVQIGVVSIGIYALYVLNNSEDYVLPASIVFSACIVGAVQIETAIYQSKEKKK